MHIVTKFMFGSMVGVLLGGCQKDVPMYQGYAFNAMNKMDWHWHCQ